MSLLILDARCSSPDTPIVSAGGCLHGMIHAWQAGQVNMTRSLIGFSKRQRQEQMP